MANSENSLVLIDEGSFIHNLERQYKSSHEINNLTTEIVQEENVKIDEFQTIMSILNNTSQKEDQSNNNLMIKFIYFSGFSKQYEYNDLINDLPEFINSTSNCKIKKEGKVIVIVLPEGIKEKNLENYFLYIRNKENFSFPDILSVLKASESFNNTNLMKSLVYETIIPNLDLSNIKLVYKKSYKMMTKNMSNKICFDLFYNTIVFISKNLLILLKNERFFLENSIDKKVIEEIIEKYFKDNDIKDIQKDDTDILINFLYNNYKVSDIFNLIQLAHFNLNKKEVVEESMLINPLFSINNFNYSKKQFQNKQNDLLTITILNEEICIYLKINSNQDPMISYFTISNFTNGESNICFTKLSQNISGYDDYLICKAIISDFSNIELAIHVKYCFTYSNLIKYLLIYSDKYYFDKKINILPKEVFMLYFRTLKMTKSNNTLIEVLSNWLFDLNNKVYFSEFFNLIKLEQISIDSIIYFCVKLCKNIEKKHFFKKFKEIIENTIAEFYKEGYVKLKIKESINLEFLIYFKTIFSEYILNSIFVASKHLDVDYDIKNNSFEQTKSANNNDSLYKFFNIDISNIKKTEDIRFLSLVDNNSMIDSYLNERSVSHNIINPPESNSNKDKRIFNNLSKQKLDNFTYKPSTSKKKQYCIQNIEEFAILRKNKEPLNKKDKFSQLNNCNSSNKKLSSIILDKSSKKEKSPGKCTSDSNNNICTLPFSSRNEIPPLKSPSYNTSRNILYSPSLKQKGDYNNFHLKSILNSLTSIQTPPNNLCKKEFSTININSNATSRVSTNSFPIKLSKNPSSYTRSPTKVSTLTFSSFHEKSLKKNDSSFKSPLIINKNEKTTLIDNKLKSENAKKPKENNSKKSNNTLESKESNESNIKFNTITTERTKTLSQRKNTNHPKFKLGK